MVISFGTSLANAENTVYGRNVTFKNLSKPAPRVVPAKTELKPVVSVPEPVALKAVAPVAQKPLVNKPVESKKDNLPKRFKKQAKPERVAASVKKKQDEVVTKFQDMEVPKAPVIAEMQSESVVDSSPVLSKQEKPVQSANKASTKTPIDVAKSDKPRTIADYKNQRQAIELVKRFFNNYGGFTVISAPDLNRKQAFLDQEPRTLVDAAKLIGVPMNQFIIDRFTKTVVISPDFNKVKITDPIVESEYGMPLKLKFGVIHNPSEGSKGNIDTSSHYLDGNPLVKEVPTPYGTLVEVHGDEIVNNSFTIEAAFAIANGSNAFKELFIQPINPQRVGDSHAK